MTESWKDGHANESWKAVNHPIVQNVIEEFASNMGFPLEGLPRYGMQKVALYAAQVARAQALGIDPESLRTTIEEHNKRMLDLAALFQEQCKPVLLVRRPDGEDV